MQKGIASYYGRRATGRLTSSGERLHHDSLTCAHRTHPFGTWLKVVNPRNGRQVVVKVNDRGPFRRGRIIDLSWGAAKEIGMIAQGIAAVTVERLSETSIPFKPEDPQTDIPRYDFEIADIAAEGIIPIWQKQTSPRIDQRKAVRSMQRTAAKSANDIMEATADAPDAQQRDILDEINSHPNASKAYQKREGKR